MRLGLGTESVILENVDKVCYTSIQLHKGTVFSCLPVKGPAFLTNYKFYVYIV